MPHHIETPKRTIHVQGAQSHQITGKPKVASSEHYEHFESERKMILTQKTKTQILEGGANNNMLHALGQIIIAIRTELILFTKTSRSAPAIKDSEHMGRNQTTFKID